MGNNVALKTLSGPTLPTMSLAPGILPAYVRSFYISLHVEPDKNLIFFGCLAFNSPSTPIYN
jgi:hypothetical protein